MERRSGGMCRPVHLKSRHKRYDDCCDVVRISHKGIKNRVPIWILELGLRYKIDAYPSAGYSRKIKEKTRSAFCSRSNLVVRVTGLEPAHRRY